MGFSFPDLWQPSCPCCLLTMGSLWPGLDPCKYFSKFSSAFLVNSVRSQRIYWKLLWVTMTLSEVWGEQGWGGWGDSPCTEPLEEPGSSGVPSPGVVLGDKGFGNSPRAKCSHSLLHPTNHSHSCIAVELTPLQAQQENVSEHLWAGRLLQNF